MASSVFEFVLVVAGALVLALLIQAFIVKPYRIPSGSMEPTLAIDQRILVDRLGNNFSSPQVGDIIVFHPPADYTACADPRQGAAAEGQPSGQACDVAQRDPSSVTFVKRVVGLPGDRLRIVNGHVIRNGTARGRRVHHPVRDLADLQLPRHDRRAEGRLLHDGRQPSRLRGQQILGAGSQGMDHRPGILHVLAS